MCNVVVVSVALLIISAGERGLPMQIACVCVHLFLCSLLVVEVNSTDCIYIYVHTRISLCYCRLLVIEAERTVCCVSVDLIHTQHVSALISLCYCRFVVKRAERTVCCVSVDLNHTQNVSALLAQ